METVACGECLVLLLFGCDLYSIYHRICGIFMLKAYLPFKRTGMSEMGLVDMYCL